MNKETLILIRIVVTLCIMLLLSCEGQGPLGYVQEKYRTPDMGYKFEELDLPTQEIDIRNEQDMKIRFDQGTSDGFMVIDSFDGMLNPYYISSTNITSLGGISPTFDTYNYSLHQLPQANTFALTFNQNYTGIYIDSSTSSITSQESTLTGRHAETIDSSLFVIEEAIIGSLSFVKYAIDPTGGLGASSPTSLADIPTDTINAEFDSGSFFTNTNFNIEYAYIGSAESSATLLCSKENSMTLIKSFIVFTWDGTTLTAEPLPEGEDFLAGIGLNTIILKTDKTKPARSDFFVYENGGSLLNSFTAYGRAIGYAGHEPSSNDTRLFFHAWGDFDTNNYSDDWSSFGIYSILLSEVTE